MNGLPLPRILLQKSKIEVTPKISRKFDFEMPSRRCKALELGYKGPWSFFVVTNVPLPVSARKTHQWL